MLFFFVFFFFFCLIRLLDTCIITCQSIRCLEMYIYHFREYITSSTDYELQTVDSRQHTTDSKKLKRQQTK